MCWGRCGLKSLLLSFPHLYAHPPPPSLPIFHYREVDVRGTYTVISIASLLNLLTPELTAGVADYLLSCQTYEGGFGGEPGHEAHGGYVFCAFAALVILGRAGEADVVSLEGWVARRQMEVEGGCRSTRA